MKNFLTFALIICAPLLLLAQPTVNKSSSGPFMVCKPGGYSKEDLKNFLFTEEEGTLRLKPDKFVQNYARELVTIVNDGYRDCGKSYTVTTDDLSWVIDNTTVDVLDMQSFMNSKKEGVNILYFSDSYSGRVRIHEYDGCRIALLKDTCGNPVKYRIPKGSQQKVPDFVSKPKPDGTTGGGLDPSKQGIPSKDTIPPASPADNITDEDEGYVTVDDDSKPAQDEDDGYAPYLGNGHQNSNSGGTETSVASGDGNVDVHVTVNNNFPDNKPYSGDSDKEENSDYGFGNSNDEKDDQVSPAVSWYDPVSFRCYRHGHKYWKCRACSIHFSGGLSVGVRYSSYGYPAYNVGYQNCAPGFTPGITGYQNNNCGYRYNYNSYQPSFRHLEYDNRGNLQYSAGPSYSSWVNNGRRTGGG